LAESMLVLRAHRSLASLGKSSYRHHKLYTTSSSSVAQKNDGIQQYPKSYYWAKYEMERAINQYGYLPGQQLQNIYKSFSYQKVLTSSHALLLLQHCNKTCADMNPATRTDLAKKIFDTAEDRTVIMYEKLLEAYLQNEHSFSTNDILKDIMDGGMKPNPYLYEKLIAQQCRTGDLKGPQHILQYMKTQGMEIPRDIFGHIAHGKCLVGNPDEGVEIIKHMLENRMKPTWRTMTALCCGLAKVGETKMLHDTIAMIYNGFMRRPFIGPVVDIFTALLQTDNWEEARQLQPYIPDISPQSLSYASHHLKLYKNGSSLLELLYNRLDRKEAGNFMSIFPAHLYLQNIIRKAESFETITENIDMLCDVHQQNQKMILREAFREVMRTKPQFTKEMLYAALERDRHSVKAHMLLPILVSSRVSDDIGAFLEKTCPDLYQQLKAKDSVLLQLQLPQDLDGILTEYHKICSNPVRYIKQAINCFLFEKDTDLEKLARVVVQIKPSSNWQDSMDNKQAILSVIMSELNERIYVSTDFVLTLHAFMKELHQTPEFPSERGNSMTVFNILSSDYHFLGKLLYETGTNIMTMKTPEEPYNRMAQKYIGQSIKEGDVDALLQSIDVGLKKIKSHSKPTFLFTVLVDSYDRLIADKFNSIANHIVNDRYLSKFLSGDSCNVIIMHCIETGNITLLKKTQQHLNKSLYPVTVKNSIDSVPLHILKKMLTDNDVHSSLMEHLSFLTYRNNAVWTVYFSLLKFRMTDEAEKFLAQNSKLSWTSMATLNCFIEQVEKSKDVVSVLQDVMKQCKNTPNFNPSPLIQACILSLLKKDLLNEAASVISAITKENYSLPHFVKMTILKKFASHGRKAPQVLEIDPELQDLATEVSAKSLDVTKVLGLIEQMCRRKKTVPVNLLCEFLCRTLMQDYPPVKKHLKTFVPWFQPELQTSVLVFGVQKLVDLSLLDDAAKYMLQNFLSVDNNNYFLWQTSVDLLTQACCLTGTVGPLQMLVKSNLQPELKDLINSRLLYTNFKLGRDGNITITPSTLHKLVSFVCQQEDTETMENLIKYSKDNFDSSDVGSRWDDKNAKPSQALLVSSAFASGYDIDQCTTWLKQLSISDKKYPTLFAASYRRAYTYDILERIDIVARNIVSNKVGALSVLNNEFVKKCGYIAADTVYFDDRMKSYLKTIFTSIPCDMNNSQALQRYQRLMHSLQYRKSLSNRAIHEEQAVQMNVLYNSFVNKNNTDNIDNNTTDDSGSLVCILNQKTKE